MASIARSLACLTTLSLALAGTPVRAQGSLGTLETPIWERPKSTHFSAQRCGGDSPVINNLILNRDNSSQNAGMATYSDSARDKGYERGAGGWTLNGVTLRVEGAGFVLEGRWVGPFLTAVITRSVSQNQLRCRFVIPALSSFTEYQ
jgi:hypothetical protein